MKNESNVGRVWDVTDIYNVQSVVNPNLATFTFKSLMGDLRKYVAVDNADIYAPSKETDSSVSNQDVKGTIFNDENGNFKDIDYLIVCPNFLKSQANRLANFHKVKSGLNVKVITTENAPVRMGTFSKAILVGNTLYLSGQIGLAPYSMELVEGIEAQIRRVFDNLKAVCEAAGGTLADIVKLNIFLTDLSNFQLVNQIMGEYFAQPYPARAALGVASLPKNALVEMDGIVIINQ